MYQSNRSPWERLLRVIYQPARLSKTSKNDPSWWLVFVYSNPPEGVPSCEGIFSRDSAHYKRLVRLMQAGGPTCDDGSTTRPGPSP